MQSVLEFRLAHAPSRPLILYLSEVPKTFEYEMHIKDVGGAIVDARVVKHELVDRVFCGSFFSVGQRQ